MTIELEYSDLYEVSSAGLPFLKNDNSGETMKLSVFVLASIIGFTATAEITARAKMMRKSGSKVSGNVEFKDIDGTSIKVSYNLKNLPKNKILGMHIHESADCTAQDASSAGKHYLKIDEAGGTSTDAPGRYIGDLLQISSDSSGKAKGSFIAQRLSIIGENAISKRSIVIHSGPDNADLPASKRIACGVIEGPPVKISDSVTYY